MLVLISDLHFVDSTAGAHNLPPAAFKSVFLSDVVALAKDKRAAELKLVLLGDIFDLVRSQQWFQEKPEDRPWGQHGLLDVPTPRANSATERRCLRILGELPADGRRDSVPPDTILYQNWETFAFFRELPDIMRRKLRRNIPVEIIYVVGNHDRLCNLYPSVRDALRQIAGLAINERTVDGDPAGEWWYRYLFTDEAYNVMARHGHQFDVTCFGGGNDLTRPGHLQCTVGDAITTEFAVGLAWQLDQLRPKYSVITDELVHRIQEVDNVRPMQRIMEWFHYQIKNEGSRQVRQALDETFDAVVNNLLNLNFVQQWRSPDTYLDELVRAASSPWLRWIPTKLMEITDTSSLLPLLLPAVERFAEGGDEMDRYTEGAYHERGWRENRDIRFVIYGHTHRPVITPLDGRGGREVLYLNTGTWRARIQRTVPLDKSADFIKLKQMTFLAFYHAKEDMDNKQPGTVSFDVWTGHKQKYYTD